MRKTFIGPAPTAQIANTDGWRAADLGAVNGHGNARSLARILSAISLGGNVNDVQLLRRETVEKIFEVQCDGPDLVLAQLPVRWGWDTACLSATRSRTYPTARSASGAAGVARGSR